jgi:hypothetical protein
MLMMLQEIKKAQKVMPQMQALIDKYVAGMAEWELKFDKNSKRMVEMNKLIYEYELISMEVYNTDDSVSWDQSNVLS